MKPKFKRTRLWINSGFQARLLLRMGLYLLVYAVVVWHIGFLLQFIPRIVNHQVGDGFGSLYFDFVDEQRPLLYASVMTLPFILYDLLKYSHRIAGPLYRCRKVMLTMADGKTVPE